MTAMSDVRYLVEETVVFLLFVGGATSPVGGCRAVPGNRPGLNLRRPGCLADELSDCATPPATTQRGARMGVRMCVCMDYVSF